MKLFIITINNEYIGVFETEQLALEKVDNIIDYAKMAVEDNIHIFSKELEKNRKWELKYIFDGITYIYSSIKLIEDDLNEVSNKN